MADTAVGRLWRRVKETFDADAEHLHRIFFPQLGAAALTPGDSYVRIWLSELFLAKQVQWGVERLPAVQASVRMLFGGVTPTTFATLVQPSSTGGASGVFEDYQPTELLPYQGQSVELQAALYEILGQNNLRTAIDIVTDKKGFFFRSRKSLRSISRGGTQFGSFR